MTDASTPQTTAPNLSINQSTPPTSAIALPMSANLPDNVTADLPHLIMRVSLPQAWFVAVANKTPKS